MNRCEICGKEYQAVRVTSRYCSDKCKQASYRNKGVSVTDISVTDKVSVTPVEITPKVLDDIVSAQNTQSPTHEDGSGQPKSLDTIAEQPVINEMKPPTCERPELEHYYINPHMYIARQEPDKMNWGKHMTMAELVQAGLKCNRVPIPGDHDYAGYVQ